MTTKADEVNASESSGQAAIRRVGVRAQEARDQWPSWLKQTVDAHQKAFARGRKRSEKNGD